MKKIIHRAESRKFFDYGLLKTCHSFSFSSYYDPEKMNFGTLRVLNDDIIAPNFGFDLHPHKNMEIVSIILNGLLKHADDQGNNEILDMNDIQAMSAGKGIFHSEFNASDKESVSILQLWILPKKIDIEPDYRIMKINPKDRQNKIHTIVAPEKSDNSLFINQDAYISLCDIEQNQSINYSIKYPGNVVYFFVISGMIDIDNEILKNRDALGISESEEFSFTAIESSKVLIIDVPDLISM